jgi:hypothetical protein
MCDSGLKQTAGRRTCRDSGLLEPALEPALAGDQPALMFLPFFRLRSRGLAPEAESLGHPHLSFQFIQAAREPSGPRPGCA